MKKTILCFCLCLYCIGVWAASASFKKTGNDLLFFLPQLNIFVCHFLIYPGICTLIFLTIQFLFLKLNQSLKIEQSNFPLYRSLKMFVLF